MSLMAVTLSFAAPATAATAETNLLTVNQATVETDLTGFDNGYFAEKLSRSTAVSSQGVASLAITSTGTTGMAARTGAGTSAAVAGAAYSASVQARAASSITSPATALVQLRFWSSSGAGLGSANGTFVRLSGSSWTRLARINAVAPAGTTSVSVYLVISSTTAGAVYYGDEWGLWRSSSLPTWAPPPAPAPVADVTPPSATRGVSATVGGATSAVTVRWTAATDNLGVALYRVFLSAAPGSGTTGTPSGTTSTTSWTSDGLSPGGYVVELVAVDAAGNVGPASPAVTVAVPAPAQAVANLLTPNQSSFETSTAGVEPSYGGVSLARSLARASDGVASLSLTATSTGGLSVRTLRGWTRVTPSATYSAGLEVLAGGGVAVGERALAQVRFSDANGAQVAVANGPWVVLSSTTWKRLSVSGLVAPATAVSVSVFTVVESATLGDVFYTDRWGVWNSSTIPAWTPATVATRPLAVFLGDSYSAGGGASSFTHRWTYLTAVKRGWLEDDMARGGTGYTKTSNSSGCGLTYCPSMQEMAVEAVATLPSVVIVCGGRNDLTMYHQNPALERQAIADTFAILRNGLPNATIVALTPMWDDTTPTPSFLEMDAWIQDAAAANGAVFVGGAETWLVGHPEWMFSDHIHPNDAGHLALANRLLAVLP